MIKHVLVCLTGLGLVGVVAGAESTAETQPSGALPAASASQPAPLEPAVEKILDRLEKKDIRDLQADLVYTKTDPVLEEEEKLTGIIRFIKDEPNPRFFIRFDKRTQEGIVFKKTEWHVFDGRWYVEAREQTRTIIKREIVRPGERVDAFRIGKGPFPLPFGQKKEDIVRHFSIRLIPPGPEDPPNSDHLECTPLPGTELHEKFGKVHFWIDRELDLPVRVQTVEKEEGREITAGFSNVRVNQGLAGSRLNLPELPGYDERVERLPEPAPTEPSEDAK